MSSGIADSASPGLTRPRAQRGAGHVHNRLCDITQHHVLNIGVYALCTIEESNDNSGPMLDRLALRVIDPQFEQNRSNFGAEFQMTRAFQTTLLTWMTFCQFCEPYVLMHELFAHTSKDDRRILFEEFCPSPTLAIMMATDTHNRYKGEYPVWNTTATAPCSDTLLSWTLFTWKALQEMVRSHRLEQVAPSAGKQLITAARIVRAYNASAHAIPYMLLQSVIQHPSFQATYLTLVGVYFSDFSILGWLKESPPLSNSRVDANADHADPQLPLDRDEPGNVGVGTEAMFASFVERTAECTTNSQLHQTSHPNGDQCAITSTMPILGDACVATSAMNNASRAHIEGSHVDAVVHSHRLHPRSQCQLESETTVGSGQRTPTVAVDSGNAKKQGRLTAIWKPSSKEHKTLPVPKRARVDAVPIVAPAQTDKSRCTLVPLPPPPASATL